ncbi:HAD-IA family hydrolase [Allosaccharopolyspora coralli]|nr:HAD-IA family hydrolase [Allosaccharopolyspora coralli]
MRALILDFGGVMTDLGGGSGADEPPMVTATRAVRAAGLRTALLSNADGGFDQPEWAELFDAVVVSGTVGVAKPDPEAYALTARRLEVPPEQCVFVDDLRRNVDGAVAVGMVGVHHHSARGTVDELEALFGLSLRGQPL